MALLVLWKGQQIVVLPLILMNNSNTMPNLLTMSKSFEYKILDSKAPDGCFFGIIQTCTSINQLAFALVNGDTPENVTRSGSSANSKSSNQEVEASCIMSRHPDAFQITTLASLYPDDKKETMIKVKPTPAFIAEGNKTQPPALTADDNEMGTHEFAYHFGCQGRRQEYQ
jgi:hypothetical protein